MVFKILPTDVILKAMDSHYQIDLLPLDFSKAFSTVAHNKLLNKLAHYPYGIQNLTLKWLAISLIGSLYNRTQNVMIARWYIIKVSIILDVPASIGMFDRAKGVFPLLNLVLLPLKYSDVVQENRQ